MEYEQRAMSFEEADRRFDELKRQHEVGAANVADFDARLKELMVQDGEGRWWSKSRHTGRWMYHDGTAWVPGTPPGRTDDYGLSPGPAPVARSSGIPAGVWIGLSIFCAVVALLFIPVLFGGVGILFGYLARRAGGQTGGTVMMIVSGVCLLLGVVMGAIIGAATSV